MRLYVLLQMILSTESLTAHGAGKGSEASVYPLVSSQFFVPGESLAAVRLITRKRSLSCRGKHNRYQQILD